MIAGLPWQAWLLLLAAVGLGIIVEVAFLAAQWRRPDGDGGSQPDA